MSKYERLAAHLRSLTTDEWIAGFDDIEKVLGFRLRRARESTKHGGAIRFRRTARPRGGLMRDGRRQTSILPASA